MEFPLRLLCSPQMDWVFLTFDGESASLRDLQVSLLFLLPFLSNSRIFQSFTTLFSLDVSPDFALETLDGGENNMADPTYEAVHLSLLYLSFILTVYL